MLLNVELLNTKIIKWGTLTAFAKALGIDPATLYRKMHGDSDFTRAEIEKTRIVLKLSFKEAKDIFFAQQLT